MHDWNSIIRERLQLLRLTAGAEFELTEELAQHLQDQYRELCGSGVAEEEAFKTVIAELDDIYPLRAQVERKQRMPIYDAVPIGDVRYDNARHANFLED